MRMGIGRGDQLLDAPRGQLGFPNGSGVLVVQLDGVGRTLGCQSLDDVTVSLPGKGRRIEVTPMPASILQKGNGFITIPAP